MALGYDSKSAQNRHYRLFVNANLEDTPYIRGNNFKGIPITRGKMIKGE
jgi:hypothetical protein